MTLVRARVMDTPDDPFTGGALRHDEDAGLLVIDGVIRRGRPSPTLRAAHPDEEVLDLRDGVLLPGFVDTHVHYPQVRVIGSLGMPLLEWLEHCALPEECRLAETSYAAAVAARVRRRPGRRRHHVGAGVRLALRAGASTRSSRR